MTPSPRFTRRTLTASAGVFAVARSAKGLAQTPAVDGETRTVTDVYGSKDIPVNPQRVIVLDGPQLDACLAVGVTPVGAVTGFEGADFPAYLGDATNGIENVGTISEPNLEQIINLEPDLILGSNLRNEDIYHTHTG